MRATTALVLLTLGTFGCGDDIPTQLPTGTDSESSTSTGGTSSADDPTTPPADSGDTTGSTPTPTVVLEVSLDLESSRHAEVQIATVGDTVQATVTPSEGFGVVADGATLQGMARIDRFEEAGLTIYTARLPGEVVAGGRCGDQPVSLALALHVDDDSDFIAGGLTPYCGADTWFGVPVIEPLRMTGRVPSGG